MQNRESWVFKYLLPILIMVLLVICIKVFLDKFGVVTSRHSYRTHITSIFYSPITHGNSRIKTN